MLRSRERWIGNASERDSRETDAIETLKAFGLTEADLESNADSERAVVVRMRFISEAEGWEGRVFAWEYVLAAATRHYREKPDQRVTVMRELTYPMRAVLCRPRRAAMRPDESSSCRAHRASFAMRVTSPTSSGDFVACCRRRTTSAIPTW